MTATRYPLLHQLQPWVSAAALGVQEEKEVADEREDGAREAFLALAWTLAAADAFAVARQVVWTKLTIANHRNGVPLPPWPAEPLTTDRD